MADDLSQRYGDLLTGTYDCVDRIVLTAYFPMDLMRMAGRFGRRLRGWAKANGIPHPLRGVQALAIAPQGWIVSPPRRTPLTSASSRIEAGARAIRIRKRGSQPHRQFFADRRSAIG